MRQRTFWGSGLLMASAWALVAALLVCDCSCTPAPLSAPTFSYTEGTSGEAEIRYHNDLPVLCLVGTPEEMGQQAAELVGPAALTLLDYPKAMLRRFGVENRWPELLRISRALADHLTPEHRAELDSLAQAAHLDRDTLLAANMMVDVYRGGLGCSSLLVDASRSATGAPLFGRNLDFYGRTILEDHGLVTVYRPRGKRAFATLGFPGFLGCVSGMNDAGLAVAVHEMPRSADGSPSFNPQGIPYAFCLRRILEECATVDEAEQLMRTLPRTTNIALVMCDPTQPAVLELTPKSVVRRGAEQGVCVATNHFRAPGLARSLDCIRYAQLEKARQAERLDVATIAAKLHEVNLGPKTLQSMIFEPAKLTVHVSLRGNPATAVPPRRLELGPVLRSGVPVVPDAPAVPGVPPSPR
jgi:isopenicillin-N N-acyltransferase like protein